MISREKFEVEYKVFVEERWWNYFVALQKALRDIYLVLLFLSKRLEDILLTIHLVEFVYVGYVVFEVLISHAKYVFTNLGLLAVCNGAEGLVNYGLLKDVVNVIEKGVLEMGISCRSKSGWLTFLGVLRTETMLVLECMFMRSLFWSNLSESLMSEKL